MWYYFTKKKCDDKNQMFPKEFINYSIAAKQSCTYINILFGVVCIFFKKI
jgi:hypothetical protein